MKTSWLPAGLREGFRGVCSNQPAIPRSLLRNRISLSSPSKPFTTTSQLRDTFAAPEINIKRGGRERERDEEDPPKFLARLVPYSPSYFTAQPLYTDNLLQLQNLVLKYVKLPTVEAAEAPRVSFRSLMEYRDQTGETVRSSKYQKIVETLHRLNHIHPSVMPLDVKEAINLYKRDIDPHENLAKPIPIDQFGRALGVGRRKSSTAKAYLVEGTGEVLVNGKTLAEAFGRHHDRESVIWALKSTDRIDKYNLWALVNGGGTTGQAEALTLAVGKALLSHEPALKPALRRAGCVTRDPRKVERKKPGHVKARKMPAWVKR
ncbi:putative 40S ribosomal protein S9, mitochondrial [Sclerotinia borealis F-4128]|uniref:Small ribosomal subunit protein uS9m n=1 Tax=Sclerotinia borealis (strain F-4128) TaxID=1432307 RepID=W9CRL6_SCLBF|nr:putative 40S ribosomal protein S9, mitochondrial [Sclerotinia borealis F-4128]